MTNFERLRLSFSSLPFVMHSNLRQRSKTCTTSHHLISFQSSLYEWYSARNPTFITLATLKRHLSDRFGVHRRSIQKAITQRHIDQPTAVSDHFTVPVHSMDNIELVPLELITSNGGAIRKAREAWFLISKGKTLELSGLNRRDEIWSIY